MADIKISSATNAGTVVASDKFPLARTGSPAAYFATAAEIASYADAGAHLTVTGGGGTVTNAATINFTSNATASSGGAGIANVAISGGGGGGYPVAPGLGLYGVTNTGTITLGNTGTIEQPAATGSDDGLGVVIRSGLPGPAGTGSGQMTVYTAYVTAAGTASLALSGNADFYTGDVVVTDPAGSGQAGQANLFGGVVSYGTVNISGARLSVSGGMIAAGTSAQGGGGGFQAGGAYGAPGTNAAGGFSVYGGDATGGVTAIAGPIYLTPGYASGASGTNINGGLIINNLPTADPHVMHQAWLGVGNGITLSSG